MNPVAKDLRASVVVFLVALPLAMGIAIASGYPPVAGLVTGIVGGIVVGFLSGSPLQVSGAAAGLTVIVFDGVQRFGLPTMGLVVLLAGLMQVVAAAGRIGRWFQAVSPTVLHGMLAGIGVLIILSQTHVMFDGLPAGGGLRDAVALPNAFANLTMPALTAGGIGLWTIALLVVWPKIAKGRLALVPAPLVAVAGGTMAAAVLGLTIHRIEIAADVFSTWKPTNLDFSVFLQRPEVLTLALQLALIASAESLLCAAALDRTHDGPRTKFDRELAAQGVGNALCGLLGVLPMTGVAVRSAANVQAGAKTRLSTMMHGVWLLLAILLIPHVLQLIPRAALAGLLVYTGIKLLNIPTIRKLAKLDRVEFGIFMMTAGSIVVIDLLTGVAIGLALSGMRLLISLSDLAVATENKADGGEVVLSLQGSATFLRLPKLAHALDAVPARSTVVVEANALKLVDQACEEHVQAWRRRHEACGGVVKIEGRFFSV